MEGIVTGAELEEVSNIHFKEGLPNTAESAPCPYSRSSVDDSDPSGCNKTEPPPKWEP